MFLVGEKVDRSSTPTNHDQDHKSAAGISCGLNEHPGLRKSHSEKSGDGINDVASITGTLRVGAPLAAKLKELSLLLGLFREYWHSEGLQNF